MSVPAAPHDPHHHEHEAPQDPAEAVYDRLVRTQVYAQEHWRELTVAAVAAVLAMSAGIGWREYRAHQRTQAAVALFAAHAQEGDTVRLDALRKVAAAHADTGSGLQAAFAGAALAFDAEHYASARELYEHVLRGQPTAALTPAALIGIGATYEAEGQASAAEARYQQVLDSYPESYARPQAQLALARLAEARGDTDAALAHYRDLATVYPGTEWERAASPRIAALAPATAVLDLPLE